jgi:pyruvate dehydrogenase E2 component (dihydrolipoamide acetyltransferase)
VSIENITVPDLGDATEVEVIELLVSVGQLVAENESLLVLESDKAAMEIPAPMAGVVKSIAVNLGDQVSTGHAMLTLDVEDTEKAASAASEAESSIGAKEAGKEKQQDKAAATEPDSAVAVTANAASITIEVPDLGTDYEVEVIEVHVKTGEKIAVDQALITLESDKAAMEVPSPEAGIVESVLLVEGNKVKTGSAVLQLLTDATTATAPRDDGAATTEPAQGVAGKADSPVPGLQQPPVTETSLKSQESGSGNGPGADADEDRRDRIYAGPAVRKLARELGVDLHQVSGSGAKSRIIKEDIHEFVKTQLSTAAGAGVGVAPAADIDFSQFGEIEKLPRSKIHKLTAVIMQRNWTTIPHVAQFNEADVTELEDFRAELKPESERKGVKLTLLPFLLKACTKALIEYPQFNVSLHSSGEYTIQKKYVHIGVAVATETGLVVPVIRNADQKTIWQLAAELVELTDKAKQRKLSRDDMQGACFTISSLGAIGGTGFIPIVNAPEVAILGVGKTAIKPVFIDDEFKPRKMLPLTLSYDHKALNGVDGGLFSTYLVKVLADIRHLSL